MIQPTSYNHTLYIGLASHRVPAIFLPCFDVCGDTARLFSISPWSIGDVLGISDAKADGGVSVESVNGEIVVCGAAEATQMEVYSISGAAIYRGPATAVAVPSSGVYVVRVAGKTVKVAVE